MIQLDSRQFGEFEKALRGVRGHFVLHSRQARDWRLRIVELGGLALSILKAGAAHFYSGAGSAGCFTFFMPLGRHEDLALNGIRFDRRKVGWLVPGRGFHVDARRPLTTLHVTISRELLVSSLASRHPEAESVLLKRNLVTLSTRTTAHVVQLARRVLKLDGLSQAVGNQPLAKNAARIALVDAVLDALLPIGDSEVDRPVGAAGRGSAGSRAGAARGDTRRPGSLRRPLPNRRCFGTHAEKRLLPRFRNLAASLPDDQEAAPGTGRDPGRQARRHGFQHLRQPWTVRCGQVRRSLPRAIWSSSVAGPCPSSERCGRQASIHARRGPALGSREGTRRRARDSSSPCARRH